MRYAVRAATASFGASPALLLLLHGTGDNEQGLLGAIGQLAPPDTVVVSLRGPLQAPFGGFRWFEGYSSAPEQVALDKTVGSSSDAVLAFVEAAPAKFGIDPKRVFLLGFSQGATLVWTTLLSRWSRPGLIAGGLALSGRLFPELMQAGTSLHARLADPTQLKDVPIFASHGVQDSVTPVDIGRSNERLLRDWAPAAGFTYKEDPAADHEISRAVATSIFQWLRRHVSGNASGGL
jgi:phospholipase/carboxylesterase